MPAPVPEVTLLTIDDRLLAVIGDDDAFEEAHGATLGEVALLAREIVEMTRVFHLRIEPPPEYGGYLFADAGSRRVVGTGGFKGGPDAAGDVEIAYGVFPPFQGQGYAKAIARSLTRRALQNGAPHVIAHTLPEVNASGSVLRGLGFQHVGTVISDPEDGPVWRWELPPEAADAFRG
jgi:ribosomal-protein-alanine N-acetyltransferase